MLAVANTLEGVSRAEAARLAGMERHVAAWTRADLCSWLERRFGKRSHPASLSRVYRPRLVRHRVAVYAARAAAES